MPQTPKENGGTETPIPNAFAGFTWALIQNTMIRGGDPSKIKGLTPEIMDAIRKRDGAAGVEYEENILPGDEDVRIKSTNKINYPEGGSFCKPTTNHSGDFAGGDFDYPPDIFENLFDSTRKSVANTPTNPPTN